ncbi:MAG: hypothetical protein ACI4PH_04530 [Faecousia sp.]
MLKETKIQDLHLNSFTPFEIQKERCPRCGNCFENDPAGAVQKRGAK